MFRVRQQNSEEGEREDGAADARAPGSSNVPQVRGVLGSVITACFAIVVASCAGAGAGDEDAPPPPTATAVPAATSPPARAPDVASTAGAPTAPDTAGTVWPDFWPCGYTDPARVPLTPEQERACAAGPPAAASTMP